MKTQALTIPSAIKPRMPACSTVKKPCSSVSVSSAMRKNRKTLIYSPRTIFSSRRYARIANVSMTAKYIKESISFSILDDLKVILWSPFVILHGLKNRLLRVPALHEALQNTLVRNAANQGPIANTLGFAVNRDIFGVALIVRLLMSCCPAAVSRLVIPVNVDAVNGAAIRGKAHVFHKILKAVKPSVAHGDSASSVIGIVPVDGIEASSLHFTPNAVKLGFAKTVCRLHFTRIFNAKTAAGSGIIPRNVGSNPKELIPAFAEAAPHYPFLIGVSGNYSEATKFLTGQVSDERHETTLPYRDVVYNNQNMVVDNGNRVY
jgi:hypothetical protein